MNMTDEKWLLCPICGCWSGRYYGIFRSSAPNADAKAISAQAIFKSKTYICQTQRRSADRIRNAVMYCVF